MGGNTWAQVFGVVDSELEEIKVKLAGNEDPLRWLLLTGKIPEREYLRWAMETYTIPLVQNDFFSIPPDPVLWNAVKDIYPWTPGFVPLAEWGGTLLIGCLQPPDFHFRIPFDSRFVLASPRSLEAYWASVNPEGASQRQAIRQIVAQKIATPTVATPRREETDDNAATKTIPLAKTSAPAAADDTNVITNVQKKAAQVRQRPADEVLADDLPAAPNVRLDIPEGLGFEPGPADKRMFIVPDGIPLSEAQVPQAPLPPPLKKAEAPDGLAGASTGSFNFGDMNENSPEAPSRIGVPVPATPDMPPPPQEAMEQTRSTAEAMIADAMVASTEATPSQNEIATAPMPSVEAVIPSGENVVEASTDASEPMSSGNGGSKGPAEMMDFHTVIGFQAQPEMVSAEASRIPFAECTNLDALAQNALVATTEIFDHSVIFLFQRGNLRPVKWTDNLYSVKGDKPDAIDLRDPSIFRIVHRTQLPYHGHVAPSPTNTQFFNHFHRGEYPKHVTIMPIMIDSQIAGMLMGIANKDIEYRESLTRMEMLTEEVAAALKPIRQATKAAA